MLLLLIALLVWQIMCLNYLLFHLYVRISLKTKAHEDLFEGVNYSRSSDAQFNRDRTVRCSQCTLHLSYTLSLRACIKTLYVLGRWFPSATRLLSQLFTAPHAGLTAQKSAKLSRFRDSRLQRLLSRLTVLCFTHPCCRNIDLAGGQF